MTISEDRLLYTPAEAGERLRLGRTTVYELMARGDLPSVRIGASRRIRRADLEAYVERLGAEPTAGSADR